MDRWQAVYNFWSSFGIPAYEENSVPDLKDLTFPYITYQARASAFDYNASGNASIWSRNTSWTEADGLSDMIMTRLQDGGENVPYTGGVIWITAGAPFSQSMSDPSGALVKRKLLTVTYNFL